MYSLAFKVHSLAFKVYSLAFKVYSLVDKPHFLAFSRLKYTLCMQIRVNGGGMSGKKGQKDSKFEVPGYVYRVTKQRKSKSMRVSEEDYTIITIYYNLYKKPRTTVLHEMIGAAAKYWEEKHEEKIKQLQEWKDKTADYDILAKILHLYVQKYGRLHVIKRRDV